MEGEVATGHVMLVGAAKYHQAELITRAPIGLLESFLVDSPFLFARKKALWRISELPLDTDGI